MRVQSIPYRLYIFYTSNIYQEKKKFGLYCICFFFFFFFFCIYDFCPRLHITIYPKWETKKNVKGRFKKYIHIGRECRLASLCLRSAIISFVSSRVYLANYSLFGGCRILFNLIYSLFYWLRMRYFYCWKPLLSKFLFQQLTFFHIYIFIEYLFDLIRMLVFI